MHGANGSYNATDTHTIQYTYDALGRLIVEDFDFSLSGASATIPPIDDFATVYTFDLAGNRIEVAKDIDRDGSIDEKTVSLYDANDRLLQADRYIPDPANSGQFTLQQSTIHLYDGTQQTGEGTYSSFSLDADTRLSTVGYSYDLMGRMTGTVQTTFGSDGVAVARRDTSTFRYDDAGFRVRSELVIETPDETGTLVVQRTESTSYLADRDNFTGYTQVLREQLQSNAGSRTVVYTLGHDVIGQWSDSAHLPFNPDPYSPDESMYTLWDATGVVTYISDGHGSTRGLLQVQNKDGTRGWGYTTGVVRNRLAYDAYGNALGFNPLYAGTTHLYSGEQYDAQIQRQFLRARWYDPATGRFQSLDPFVGIQENPWTFHKYGYVHGDPINFIDPTGLTEGGLSGLIATINSWVGMQIAGVQLRAIGVLATRPLIAKALIYTGSAIGVANAYLDPADFRQDMLTAGPAGFLDDVWDLVRNARNNASHIKGAFAFIGNASNGLGVGAIGRIIPSMVNRRLGTSASSHLQDVDIPGWDELGSLISNPNERARGHLWAGWFGGQANTKEWAMNLVPLWKSANQRMEDCEREVARQATNGDYEAVWLRVNANRGELSKVPISIDMEAIAENG
jgi:RHS repeat-associated protein